MILTFPFNEEMYIAEAWPVVHSQGKHRQTSGSF